MLSTLRNTFKNSLIYSIGTLSSRLIGFILIPLYTSKFSISEYGVLGILEVTSQIFISLLGYSLYNAYLRWYWDEDFIPKRKSTLFTILLFVSLSSILLLLILREYSFDIASLLVDDSEYGSLILLVSIVASLEAIGLIGSTLLRILNKPIYYTGSFLIKISINLFLTVYLILNKGKGIEAVYQASLIGNIVYLIILLPAILKNIKISIEYTLLKDMLKFSSPLIIVSITGIIFTITDRYVIKFLSNLEEVGLYSLGYKMANTIKVFVVTSVNLALQPILYKKSNDPDNKRFYSKVLTYYSFGLMFFILFACMFSKEIVKFLAKDMSYWSSYVIVPIISFSIFFGALRDVTIIGLNLLKKTQIIAVLLISVSILNIALNLFLIPYFGYIGAAIATCISQIIYFIFIYYFSQKSFKVPYEMKKIILVLLTGIGLYLLSLPFDHLSLTLRLIIKLILIISFPFILYIFNFYDPIEKLRLKQFWLKWKNLSEIINNFKSLKTN